MTRRIALFGIGCLEADFRSLVGVSVVLGYARAPQEHRSEGGDVKRVMGKRREEGVFLGLSI